MDLLIGCNKERIDGDWIGIRIRSRMIIAGWIDCVQVE
jgi:hypothetical protein